MTKDKIFKFIGKELLLIIIFVLTFITCFFVPIDKKYLEYFDYTTLISLFCILAVVAGLKDTNIFEIFSKKLISLLKTKRALIFGLVFGTFFFDMIVANDMSLITFLPLTYIVLHSTGNDKYLAFTFIMQNIAANMGGMITPYGNPQNLYLYSYYNIPIKEFFNILSIQSILVFLLLFICCSFIPKDSLEIKNYCHKKLDSRNFIIYSFLFFITILSIFRVFSIFIPLILIFLFILIKDRSLLKKIDYSLIFTFTLFFIFSGNMSRISQIKEFIYNIISNNTLLGGIISCQLISNVPTSIFLSQFTNNYKDLLIAVNIGSLGIIISSLASLITIKEFLKHQHKNFWKYIGMFTIFNTLFLFALTIVTIYIKIYS